MNKPLRVSIHVRRHRADAFHLGALGFEHGVEAGHELGIPIAHEERDLGGALTERRDQVAGLLGDPFASRMGLTPPSLRSDARSL